MRLGHELEDDDGGRVQSQQHIPEENSAGVSQ